MDLAQGKTVAQVCKNLGGAEQTYYRSLQVRVLPCPLIFNSNGGTMNIKEHLEWSREEDDSYDGLPANFGDGEWIEVCPDIALSGLFSSFDAIDNLEVRSPHGEIKFELEVEFAFLDYNLTKRRRVFKVSADGVSEFSGGTLTLIDDAGEEESKWEAYWFEDPYKPVERIEYYTEEELENEQDEA